jgi:Domain of unknown function (DUF397)
MSEQTVRRIGAASPEFDAGAQARPGAAELVQAKWQKSSWSSFNGNCVEVAKVAGGRIVGVRDSKDTSGPALIFDDVTWRSFVESVKDTR